MSKYEISYQNALKLLRSRRRQKRPETKTFAPVDQLSPQWAKYQRPNGRGKPSAFGMRSWLHQIGHSDADIDGLHIIHVAGTKGKGSTCAFAESFLGAYSQRMGFPFKYGLYTSPPLHEEVERIRINSKPISKQKFAENLFEIWERLELAVKESEALPKFLQLVFLVCIHTFIKEGVQVAILETHHGGQFDSTNIFRRSAATGIASLGFDHVEQLGPNIEDIAWHKAGIFKKGCPAFALNDQPEAARQVLIDRAEEFDTKLQFIHNDSQLPLDHPVLKASVQRSNCSLARALVNSYLEQEAPGEYRGLNDHDARLCLEKVYLPGRFQKLVKGPIHWYLDGAHNAMCIGNPVQWFSEEVQSRHETPIRQISSSSQAGGKSISILAFSHITTERDGKEVLQALIASIQSHSLSFDYIVFCYDGLREDGSSKQDAKSGSEYDTSEYSRIWEAASLSGELTQTSTIDEVMSFVNHFDSDNCRINVLVTGSFHLVGGVLARLNTAEESSGCFTELGQPECHIRASPIAPF